MLQAHERMAATNIALVVLNALQLLPVLFRLIHGPQDIYVYAIATLPFMLAGVAYNLWYIGRHRLARLPARSGQLWWGVGRPARGLAVGACPRGSITIYTNSDILILGFTDSTTTRSASTPQPTS